MSVHCAVVVGRRCRAAVVVGGEGPQHEVGGLLSRQTPRRQCLSDRMTPPDQYVDVRVLIREGGSVWVRPLAVQRSSRRRTRAVSLSIWPWEISGTHEPTYYQLFMGELLPTLGT